MPVPAPVTMATLDGFMAVSLLALGLRRAGGRAWPNSVAGGSARGRRLAPCRPDPHPVAMPGRRSRRTPSPVASDRLRRPSGTLAPSPFAPFLRRSTVHARIAIAAISLILVSSAVAQEKKQRIEKVSDLPTFTYKVDGRLEEIVRDGTKFKAFAADVRRDTESVLATYEIADKAKVRELMTLLVRLDLLDGRNDAALRGALA